MTDCPVNSYNEWDPLEEIIVGDGFPSTLPALDFSFRLFFHDNIYGQKCFGGEGHQLITKRHVEEHREDVEQFVQLLTSLGVTVKRPKVPKHVYKTKTPWWESTIYPALNVRDLSMIVGDMIIESAPTCRWRYFETDFLKHLFLEYFEQGAKWIQAPKPIMLDSSFDLSYVNEDTGAREFYEHIKDDDPHYMDMGYEIMFDAANCVRMGKHILVNASNENQWRGAKWLQSVLPDHIIEPIQVTDSHIDSTFLPIRPGLGIIMKEHTLTKLPIEIQKWDLIYIPLRYRSPDEYSTQGIKLASPRIELNVLSINPELIICHPQYEDILREKLKPHGVEVMSSPIRHCEIFSGAHHCLTLDVKRKGKLENYLS
jgi:glycine amidinotransferase